MPDINGNRLIQDDEEIRTLLALILLTLQRIEHQLRKETN